MRAFVAIVLPEPMRDEVARLAAQVDFGRAVSPENLHLTLAFLGDQPPEALEAFDAELSALRLPAPPLAVDGLDVFGGDDPRVLFASVTDHPDLTALQSSVRRAAHKSGLALAHQRFRPHVTLCRMSPRDRFVAAPLARFLGRFVGIAIPAQRPVAFGLFASTLGPDGPSYEPLALYPFAT